MKYFAAGTRRILSFVTRIEKSYLSSSIQWITFTF